MKLRFGVLYAVGTAWLLTACGGGSGGASGFCDSITGGGAEVTSTCSGCTVSNEEAAADGNRSTFATVTVPIAGGPASTTIRATAQEGIVFPAGSFAGVFYTPRGGTCNNCGITITTYLDGSPQESNSGTNNSEGSGGGAAFYTGINTFLPFDAVEIADSTDTNPVSGDDRLIEVYEICSDGSY